MAAPLTLSALSLELAVVLAQRPDGSRAADLTRIAEAPHTSVQNSLRHLVEHGFVRRSGLLYWLVADHPAAPDLVNLGLRVPPPEAAIALVLRANDAVEFALVDVIGFLVGERRADHPVAWPALDRSLTTILRDRDGPGIVRFETLELARILGSAMGLRARLARGDPLKGLPPRPRDPDPGSRVRRS